MAYLCPKGFKGLITLCVVFLAFILSSRFLFFLASLPTWYQKCEEKPQENGSKTGENVSILYYMFGKNASQLPFFAFCSVFAHVLLSNLTKTQTQRIV